ncbi:potassium channel family protein [Acidobacterium sp. S8]|uniref:potassium channel family protein n=1 Tax=Acidobacterium sp. S8 TaxID=1641854 RepID=UPI00131A8F9D|nr:potassium channel family protein [Acidobacterium sp. S8]
MQILTLIAGIACLFLALLDAFQTVILPRRATGNLRITRIFYIVTWIPWSWLATRVRHERKRETMLSFYGPLSLVLLIVIWASALVLGFALIFYALGSPFSDPLGRTVGLRSDIYVSGTTLFTLGLGDVVPRQYIIRDLVIVEAGMGLGFVAMVIGYFPVLYGAFSKREVSISLLDARAGSPPSAVELLRRHSFEGGSAALILLLEEWERWSAELLESHISYPLLCYFRSQHTHQSWLSALTAILDACALLIAGVQDHSARQAQLTFAMARHAMVDLAQVFSLPPVQDMVDRLPEKQFEKVYDQMCQTGVRLCQDAHSAERLRQMRALYEGYAEAFSVYLCMPLPQWLPQRNQKDNWLSVARLRAQAEGKAPTDTETTFFDEEHHVF